MIFLDKFDINVKRGLSGCKLQLIDDHIVKKISNGENYNIRLSYQSVKQTFFHKNFYFDKIKTPTIKKSGYTDSLFFFDMDYVSGISPFEFFLISDKSQIDFFYTTIKKYLTKIKSVSKVYPTEKLKSTLINKLESLNNSSEYDEFIFYLINQVKTLQEFSYESFCHGDFTLTNIICKSNYIFFIDFLDSFFESYIIDLVKLKQDLFYLWTIKNDENFTNQEILKISQISRYLWCKIETDFYFETNSEVFKILDCMNFLRIEPYITNLKIKKNFYNIIKLTKSYEEFISTNGR